MVSIKICVVLLLALSVFCSSSKASKFVDYNDGYESSTASSSNSEPGFEFTLEKILLGLGATNFLEQIERLGLKDYILQTNTDSRTLFAPTNAAIGNQRLSRETVLYHCLPTSYNASQLEDEYIVPTLLYLPSLGSQQVLKFLEDNSTEEGVAVNGEPIYNQTSTINTNFQGYVYLIDAVLSTPVGIMNVLHSNNFTTFARLIEEVHLPWINNDSLTVFAPTEDAFDMLAPGVLGYLLSNYTGEDLLTSILFGHIIDDTVAYSTVIPVGTTVFQTIEPRYNATIRKNIYDDITVNGAAVVDPDLLASNGVVHGINRLLLPDGLSFSIQNVLEGLGGYSMLLGYLKDTGLLNNINTTFLTIFAPDDEAFEEVDDLDDLVNNKTKLTQVLLSHIVYRNVTELRANESLPTGVDGLSIYALEDDEVELRNNMGETVGSKADIVVVTYGRNGYAFGINRVLGVDQATGSSGLKKWQIALIVIGSIIGALLLLVIIIALFFLVHHVYYKNKTGYTKLND